MSEQYKLGEEVLVNILELNTEQYITYAVKIIGLGKKCSTGEELVGVAVSENIAKNCNHVSYRNDNGIHDFEKYDENYNERIWLVYIHEILGRTNKQSTTKIIQYGYNCIHCHDRNEYAEANLTQNRYICYSCKESNGWKYA